MIPLADRIHAAANGARSRLAAVVRGRTQRVVDGFVTGLLTGDADWFHDAVRRPWADRPQRVGAVQARGVAVIGAVWMGEDAFDGCVIVGPDGRIAALGPSSEPPDGVRVIRGGWIGPGIVDAHVHLAFSSPEALLRGGVVGARDLGSLPVALRWWRRHPELVVVGSGPMLTASDGYPTRTWGEGGGFSQPVPDGPNAAAGLIRALVRNGATLVKIALEPAGGAPVPTPAQVRAIVRAAHEAGLPVVAHALAVDMVERALDAGVDELAHVPTELLPASTVDRIAAAGVTVVSTLQCHAGLPGFELRRNAAALVEAGAALVYGTDLGNTGTRPGVDPRELDRLADAGLGRLGALRAATAGSSGVAGFGGRVGDGVLRVGDVARLVVLGADPLVEPSTWRAPVAVITGTSLVVPDR